MNLLELALYFMMLSLISVGGMPSVLPELQRYAVDVKGLSVGDVGITKLEASGKVYNLKSIGDFSGNYTGVAAGATVAGGGGATTMRNQNGVTIDMVSTTQGVKIALGANGVDMKIKE